jgi:hypothetical protein
MPPTDPLAFVTDYEALRACFLASQASPDTRSGFRRLIGEGLHAWLKRQSLACPGQAQRALPPCSRPLTAEVSDHDALIQLIASMTLGSLVVAEESA